MPGPGATPPGGELGRTPRNRGGTTRGTPATASTPGARAAFKISRFTRCANAYTHKTTHPPAGEATSPAMFRHRKKDAPNRASHAGRTLGRARPTCIPSHTEPAPRPDSAPRGRADARQALLRRTGGRRATRNEPTQRSHAPDSRNHSPHIVFSATLRRARIQMAKRFLPTPQSRTPALPLESRPIEMEALNPKPCPCPC
ncbi:hypothetical protein BDL97_16G000100, partial [Sphagnum fallax]